jgi:hypothetical protein
MGARSARFGRARVGCQTGLRIREATTTTSPFAARIAPQTSSTNSLIGTAIEPAIECPHWVESRHGGSASVKWSRPCSRDGSGMECEVSTENWSQERERLVRLLEAVEAGTVTHIDQENLRQLQATNSDNVTAIKARLAELNKRLGPGDGD